MQNKVNVPQVVRKYLACSGKYYDNKNEIRRLFLGAQKKYLEFKNRRPDAVPVDNEEV